MWRDCILLWPNFNKNLKKFKSIYVSQSFHIPNWLKRRTYSTRRLKISLNYKSIPLITVFLIKGLWMKIKLDKVEIHYFKEWRKYKPLFLTFNKIWMQFKLLTLAYTPLLLEDIKKKLRESNPLHKNLWT